jgi:hypothetical protein
MLGDKSECLECVKIECNQDAQENENSNHRVDFGAYPMETGKRGIGYGLPGKKAIV